MSVSNLSKLIAKEVKLVFSKRSTVVSIGIYVVLMSSLLFSRANNFKEFFLQLITVTTFLLFSFTFSSQLFLSERINNTLEFLLTTPLSFSEIVFGKTLAILLFSSVFSLIFFFSFSVLNFGIGFLTQQLGFLFLLLLILNLLFFPFLNIVAVLQLLYGETAAMVFNLLFFLGFFKLKAFLNLFKTYGKTMGIFVLLGIVILYFIEYYVFNRITYERLIKSA